MDEKNGEAGEKEDDCDCGNEERFFVGFRGFGFLQCGLFGSRIGGLGCGGRRKLGRFWGWLAVRRRRSGILRVIIHECIITYCRAGRC